MTFIVTTRPNNAPSAVADRLLVDAERMTSLDILANDTDNRDPTLIPELERSRLDPGSIRILDAPDHGTFTIANGLLLYRPADGFFGVDRFTYTVADNEGVASNAATVRIAVGPLAVDDTATAVQGVPLELPAATLLGNDKGGALRIVEVGGAVGGNVALGRDGSVVFTPDATLAGEARFTYTVEDRGDRPAGEISLGTRRDTAEVTVAVLPRADAVDDALGAVLGEARVIEPELLLRNDVGQGLEVIAVGGAVDGTVSRDAAGRIVFEGDDSDIGSFTYTVSDGIGPTDTATVVVTFDEGPPDPPSAGDDVLAPVARRVPVEIAAETLLANDTGDGLLIAGVRDAVGARVRVESDGDLVVEATTLGRQARFTYTVVDRFGQQDDAVVTVPVVAVPDARDDSLLAEAGRARVIEAGDLLANDIGADLQVTRVLDAGGNELARNARGDFVLDAMPAGQARLSYEIAGVSGGDQAAVSFEVVARPPAGPDARDDAAAICSNRVLTLDASDLLANDTGSTLRIDAVGGAVNGTITREGDSFLFRPDRGHVGPASFTYTLADGLDRADTAVVRIDVTAPIVAVDDRAATLRDTPLTLSKAGLLADDSGDGLRLVGVGGAVNGTVELSGSGVVFTPAAGLVGAAGFTYSIEDASGCRDTARVAVAVEERVPAAPDAVDDSLAGCGGSDLVISPTTLTGNDTGVALDVVGLGSAIGGTVRIEAGQVIFTPDDGFVGTARFTYRIKDGFGGTDTARVLVEVEAPPDALDDARAALQDTPLRFPATDLLANDLGDGLRVVALGSAVGGSAKLEGDEIVFTPAAGFTGETRFTYRIEDADGCRDVARVHVDVRAPAPGEPPVDVLLLTDLAGSFEPTLRQTLPGVADDIADIVQATTPQGRFGLASFIDQPIGPFGLPGDHVYRAELPFGDDRADLQAAIAGLTVGAGGDGPMSTLDALSQALLDPTLGFDGDAARVVVVTTTHRFHFEGDGSGGDYVAIDDLASLLAAQDVAPIFAVPDDLAADYQGLVAQLGRGVVTPLAADSDAFATALADELARGLGLPEGASEPPGATGL
jgi:hypothetical protein